MSSIVLFSWKYTKLERYDVVNCSMKGIAHEMPQELPTYLKHIGKMPKLVEDRD